MNTLPLDEWDDGSTYRDYLRAFFSDYSDEALEGEIDRRRAIEIYQLSPKGPVHTDEQATLAGIPTAALHAELAARLACSLERAALANNGGEHGRT